MMKFAKLVKHFIENAVTKLKQHTLSDYQNLL